MNIKECYDELQGNFTDACSRLINEAMVTRFVQKFPQDPCMQQLRDAVAEGNIETSFRAVHTLKGVAGNLAFTKLYQAAWNLTEQLRPRLEQADPALLSALEEEYARTIAAIERLGGGVNASK